MARSPVFRRPTRAPRRRRFWPAAATPSQGGGAFAGASVTGTAVRSAAVQGGVCSAGAGGAGAAVKPASAFTPRPKSAATVDYEIVVVGRVPQTAGPPTLIEVDPIDGWTGLSWTEELSRPPTLDMGAKLSTLTAAVLGRLRALHELATELRVLRNGLVVFAGPLLGAQRQGESVTFRAAGLLHYAQWMVVTTDLVFTQVDQFVIVRNLVDHWQGLEYGNFGIDTNAVGTSGILRDATYLRTERNIIGQRIEEMGRRANGFDAAVDPVTRQLQLRHPQQGVDRATGPTPTVIDSGVTNPDLVISAGVDDLASEGFAVGTSNLDTVYGVRSNLQLRASFGRTGTTESFSGVSEQATIDAHAQGLVDARGRALVVPGPDLVNTPDADTSTYGVGDTVQYVTDDEMAINGAFRIRKRVVSTDGAGQERISLEFT